MTQKRTRQYERPTGESAVGTEAELRAAMNRLLAGRPFRGSRDLTVTNLALEAGVSRATANRYPEVLEEFRSSIRAREEAPTPPDDREALRRLEAQYNTDRSAWRAREKELEELVQKYAQQIQYLSVVVDDLQAKNGATAGGEAKRVIPLRPKR